MITDSIPNQSFERKLSIALSFAVYAFGIWYFCLRSLGVGLEYIPGDFGDSRFINYLLEHGYHWIQGKTGPFWDAPFMYPYNNSIGISDNMLGTMPFYAFCRSMGLSTETAYQLWWITICSLNFWSAYIVIKKWFNRWDLAIIVAWIFAFTIFNMGQLNYMQMIIRFMVPIVIYAGARWVETSSIKYFAIFSFGIVYQYYSVIYTGFFLMYFSLGFVLIYAIVSKKYFFYTSLFQRKNLAFTVLVCTTSITAMLWLMMPYLETAKLLGVRLFDEVRMHIPVWQAFLFPQESSFLWHSFSDIFRPNVPYWWVHYTFPGIVPLLGIVAIPFIWIYYKVKSMPIPKVSLALTLAALLIFVLYIRTDEGTTLYTLIFSLPGMSSIRVVNRFMHVELFLILAGLTSLLKWFPKKYTILLFIIVFLDNTFIPSRVIRRPKAEISERRKYSTSEIERQLKPEHIAFAIVDTTDRNYATHLDAMHTSAALDIPTINGYSSSCHGEFGLFFSKANREGLLKWLRYNNIDTSQVLIIYRDENKGLKMAY